jgi:hypothetical protein
MTDLPRVTWPAALALVLLAACGDGGSGGDTGGTPVDPTGGPITPGTPITVTTPETWEWIDVAGTACGDGSSTGIGVNLTTVTSDVVVYLQGGGACWDALTCFTLGTAANLDGYGSAEFAAEPILLEELVDRASPTNPFPDASYVFVPYCTGDLFSGMEVHTYGGSGTIHHVGAANLEAILPRLAATFPGARRVFVAGSSAGGFGVQLRFHRFVAAFPDADLHGLADGSQLVQPQNALIESVLGSWNLQLPPGCRTCATSFPALAEHLAATWPDHRIGLTASTEDPVLDGFFGYPDAATFSAATRALLASDAYQASAAQRYFAMKEADHTMLGRLDVTSAAGLTLREWLVRWRDGDAAWANEAAAP